MTLEARPWATDGPHLELGKRGAKGGKARRGAAGAEEQAGNVELPKRDTIRGENRETEARRLMR